MFSISSSNLNLFIAMKTSQPFTKVVIFIFLGSVKVYAVPELVITNDGPAMLNSPITFTAVLNNYVRRHPLNFIFDDGVQKSELENQLLSVKFIRPFPADLYKEGSYYMNVTVTASILFYTEIVAVNLTVFQLKRDLIGQIGVYRSSDTQTDVDEVPIGDNITLSVNLIDNHKYLQNYELDYTWSVDYEEQETLNNTLIYNFSDPGVKHISAKVTAFDFRNNDFKYGFFERVITAKVPVQNVNISGNPFLYHGDTLNLNVTCNGTPPFLYCYKVLKNNSSRENFSCTPISTFTTCHMEIIKYFQNDGTYNVGIYVSNNVGEKKRVIEVMVYSVAIKPTLSTVIIPIVCTLLALIIIAMGISYFIQQRKHLVVEVANFNFQEESSDSYTERTFFEKIMDSVTCRSCICAPFACRRGSGEAEPLVVDA